MAYMNAKFLRSLQYAYQITSIIFVFRVSEHGSVLFKCPVFIEWRGVCCLQNDRLSFFSYFEGDAILEIGVT